MPDDDLLGDVEHLVCVLATTTRSGTPIARPASVLRDAGSGTFTVDAGPLRAGPARRADVRHDPRVALLFSGPVASGRQPAGSPSAGSPAASCPPREVLVQGEARSPDDAAAALAQMSGSRRGRSAGRRVPGADRLSRGVADLAHGLLVVAPTRVHGRPPLADRTTTPPPTAPPGARSGIAGEGSPAFRVAARRLAAGDGVHGAVLAAHDGSGAPWLLRVRPVPDPATGTFLVEVPPGEPVRPGPASLLAHDPDDRRPWPAPGVLGHLARTGGLWVFTPHGRIPGVDVDAVAVLAGARDAGRAARRRLVPRPLLPPPVPGAELAFADARRP